MLYFQFSYPYLYLLLSVFLSLFSFYTSHFVFHADYGCWAGLTTTTLHKTKHTNGNDNNNNEKLNRMCHFHFSVFAWNCISYRCTTGNQELQPLNTQTNKRETGNNRTWSATSIVQIPATRERHGETIKCVAIHESYASKSLSVEAKLDVKCKYTVHRHHQLFNINNPLLFFAFILVS